MSAYYLAIDIGASSGRHILGCLRDEKLVIEEIHRFENGAKQVDGRLLWDTEALFSEILSGLAKCRVAGKTPKSLGIDTWGVDYVLLNRDGARVGHTYAYRDSRTEGMDEVLSAILPPAELYRRTGLQRLPINSIYQLLALKEREPADLAAAECFLMIPDYFHYLLTGVRVSEYTNATTTQLVNVRTKDWDREMISMLGIDDRIFRPLARPGTRVGKLSDEIVDAVGFCCDVVLPATHDTGSAVMAVPVTDENGIYISSGTWSLMGCELPEPITSPESFAMNFTNEGGYDYRYRFLKNIMGLWMIQSLRRELLAPMSYGELTEAAEAADIDTVVDCNDNRFLAPNSMIKAIQNDCRRQGRRVPETPGELTAVVHKSLAVYYGKTRDDLARVTGKTFSRIHIVGGGAHNRHLNRLTAENAGIPVYAGPGEATAIGNLLAQMIADGEFANLAEARRCVGASCEVVSHVPSI
jgi:rhamnulokinase